MSDRQPRILQTVINQAADCESHDLANGFEVFPYQRPTIPAHVVSHDIRDFKTCTRKRVEARLEVCEATVFLEDPHRLRPEILYNSEEMCVKGLNGGIEVHIKTCER